MHAVFVAPVVSMFPPTLATSSSTTVSTPIASPTSPGSPTYSGKPQFHRFSTEKQNSGSGSFPSDEERGSNVGTTYCIIAVDDLVQLSKVIIPYPSRMSHFTINWAHIYS
ncbi:hypothetical protein SCHPADRAFT_944818 [Schizopora paradoxa]|uniref:Uncharacterized protein n=1 Tax=Schizopora paradoxa TaxID=27342 RepID=A0A0H2R9C0_9AGAM|nr:hypothetical protein SCHPADRAFT_944818 [Schizopora paradoxa]